jgi:hypothetical protein
LPFARAGFVFAGLGTAARNAASLSFDLRRFLVTTVFTGSEAESPRPSMPIAADAAGFIARRSRSSLCATRASRPAAASALRRWASERASSTRTGLPSSQGCCE